jgi:alkylhydroperoxidase/carboxymuconolactone decarboxylase family protein YurZ
MTTADHQACATPDAMRGVSLVGLVSRLRACAAPVFRLIHRRHQRRRSSWESAMDTKRSILRSLAAAAVTLIASGIDARASPQVELRCEHGERVAAVSHHGPQTLIDRLHVVCPPLGRIVEEFALRDLGENMWLEDSVPHAREMALIAALAASGDTVSAKRHAQHALQSGATQLELKEVLYVTAVSAGVPQAIEATRALLELLTEPE